MRQQLFAALGFATAAFFSTTAHAIVIASNTTNITQTAQTFSRTFALDGTKYTGVSLSITAKGDYGTNYNVCDDEFFNLFIDGYQVGHWSNTSAAGLSVTENVKDYDYTLSGTFNITDMQWAALAADNSLTIGWKNGADVHAYSILGGPDYVSFSVQGSLMPSTTPISTSPVVNSPVTTSPVTSTPVASVPGTIVVGAGSSSAAKAVPEPASIALLGLGLAGLAVARRRRKA